MWRSMLKTAAATAAYCAVHSAFASDATKRRARDLVGDRAFDGLYRGFYNAQSVAGLAALAAYIRGLPDRELYRATGGAALALRTGQAAGLAYATWAQGHVGLLRFAGLDSLAAWAVGRRDVPGSAVGQGPSPEGGDAGAMATGGPFQHSRHPLNAAATAVLWLNPRMTANLVAFNAVATAYLFFGSYREEARLRAAYGRAYAAYQRSGVPFYLPGVR